RMLATLSVPGGVRDHVLGRVALLPDRVRPLLDAVAVLARGAVDGVPVIVQRSAGATRSSATEMAGITSGRVLSSINGMSLTVDGDGQWWQELRAEADSAAAAADE